MRKVLCPRHQEKTPSCVIYADGAYCFGCGSQIPLKELGIEESETVSTRKEFEDLRETRNYIATLSNREIRGHNCYYDDHGFYILWPDSSYYIYRLFKEEGPTKYLKPKGHKAPLFRANQCKSDTLILVEGQLNALSLSLAFPEFSVFSPGGAQDFISKTQRRYLHEYADYDKVIIIVDRDKAGVLAAISLKSLLSTIISKVDIILMEEDANSIHVSRGIKELRHQIEMSERL